MSRLNLHDVRCEALFASALQRSDDPSGRDVADAIARSVHAYGSRGCAALMAQEFGDHPEAAAARMRWVHALVVRVFAPGTTRQARSYARGFAMVAGPVGPAGVQRAA